MDIGNILQDKVLFFAFAPTDSVGNRPNEPPVDSPTKRSSFTSAPIALNVQVSERLGIFDISSANVVW